MKKVLTILLFLSAMSVFSQPLEIIASWPPAGPTDVFARATQRYLIERTGRPAIVVNKPGADGRIGGRYSLTKQPDGSSIVIVSTGFLLFNKVLTNNPGYDYTDFDLVTPVVRTPTAIIVPMSSKITNFQEFVAASKSTAMNCGTSNQGSAFSAEYLKSTLSLSKLEMIPFKGGADVLTALLGGHINCAIDTFASYKTAHVEHRLKIIAIASGEPDQALPEISLIRTTLPGYEFYNWFGVGILVSTPGIIKDPMLKILSDMYSDQRFIDSLVAANFEIVKPSYTHASLDKEYQKINKIREQMGIRRVE